MKKILITGASGFIGSHFLEHVLISTDWEVVCLASWKHKGTPERILESKYYDPARVTVITHDLVAPVTKQTIKRIGEVDYIVNFAAESHVDRSIDEPVSFIQNNVNVMLNMMELSRELNPEKFIQISTDEVYGVAPSGVNHTEWSSIVPSNPYSASKACQEAIAISYWRTYGVPLIITNTMNNFGERQDSEKYVAQLISKIAGDEVVTVHGSDEYIGSRFYLHARNHADAVLFLLLNKTPTMFDDGDHTLPDRFNVVGDKEINNLELAQLVAKIMGKELKYELLDFHATRPGHDRRYALDGSKLRDLGWVAPLDLEKSLTHTIDWTITHPEWL